jgi:hypothetical protein
MQMRFSRLPHAVKPAALIVGAALASALAYPAGAIGGAHQPYHGARLTAAAVAPSVFPGCAWPIETTPTTANVAAPDPYATYWLTPFLAQPTDSITITGPFPKSRFMSFAVYNDSFQLFANTVDGKSVPSDLSDYQINPDRGTTNPWRSGRTRKGQRFTIRLLPAVTAAQQRSENAIPMIDQNPPASPSGPAGVGYVIFRTYIPAGGNTTVQLPAITITHGGRSITLPPCQGSGPSIHNGSADAQAGPGTVLARALSLLTRLRDDGVTMSCTSGCAAPQLQYFGPSADSQAGLFPNPVNGYLEMAFTPRPGYVVVTHGRAPTSPVNAGHGVPGNSIGAYPVSWVQPKFGVRYWSVANYLDQQPYPVVEVGRGSRAVFGGTPDYLTRLKHGYYTVVSSLPSDKPSAASLRAHAATWIPMSASHAATPEFQLLRNMLSQQALYPEGFVFIPPPANPSDIIPPATVRQAMGAYYPQTAQCPVATFEARGWAGCLSASSTHRKSSPKHRA